MRLYSIIGYNIENITRSRLSNTGRRIQAYSVVCDFHYLSLSTSC